MTNFDPFSIAKSILPQTIGFDRMFTELENAQKQMQKVVRNYPPYNIKKVDDNRYVLELAVAGFGKHDIDLELQDGVLTIKGSTTLDTLTKDGVDIQYLHKGIADSSFSRQFTLADTIQIKNAELFNGMLKIWLENIIPDSKKPRKIDITDSATGATGAVGSDSAFISPPSTNGSTKQFLQDSYENK